MADPGGRVEEAYPPYEKLKLLKMQSKCLISQSTFLKFSGVTDPLTMTPYRDSMAKTEKSEKEK